MFFDNLNAGPFPTELLKSDVKTRLGNSILQKDAVAFRKILLDDCPSIANDHRLYGVIIRTAEGMTPILCDEFGTTIGPDYVIDVDTAIHLLNLEFDAGEIQVTLGDEVWRVSKEGGGTF